VPDRAQLWSLGFAILGAFAAITWCEVNEERRHRVACWENRVIDGALSPLSTRDWHVIPLTMAACGALGWLVPVASVGAHVFWIATAVLCWRVLRRARAA
jgi:hypothetical protein